MNQYWSDLVSSVLLGMILLLALLGLMLAVIMPGVERWSRRFFVCFFVALELGMCSLFAYPIASAHPALKPWVPITDLFSSLLEISLLAMPAVYLLHVCEEDWRRSPLFRGVVALCVANVPLFVVSLFTDAFFRYEPDLRISFGPWYWLLMVPMMVTLVLTLVGAVRRRDRLSQRLFIAFLIFTVPLTALTIVHMVVHSFLIVYAGITISALAMFLIVLSDQFDKYLQLQRETARQRAKIAVLRMRPHFIHNTMTSIYYLCEQDPKAAQQVTLDFNTYLHKNFTAIVKDEPIPFADELEHTRAYLSVEQAQFANKLVVDYDTPHTQFRMPPLTLQPLVENAVKHGMNPDTVPLRISIRTRKTDSGSEVVVEDNGPGFDPAIVDDPHTTLANIRQRLEMMCDGTLTIETSEEGGSKATISIGRGGGRRTKRSDAEERHGKLDAVAALP